MITSFPALVAAARHKYPPRIRERLIPLITLRPERPVETNTHGSVVFDHQADTEYLNQNHLPTLLADPQQTKIRKTFVWSIHLKGHKTNKTTRDKQPQRKYSLDK